MSNPNNTKPPAYWMPDSALKLSDAASKMTKHDEEGITERVKLMRLLATSFITLAQDTAVAMPWNARHIALAITNAENALMWLEKATDP